MFKVNIWTYFTLFSSVSMLTLNKKLLAGRLVPFSLHCSHLLQWFSVFQWFSVCLSLGDFAYLPHNKYGLGCCLVYVCMICVSVVEATQASYTFNEVRVSSFRHFPKINLVSFYIFENKPGDFITEKVLKKSVI